MNTNKRTEVGSEAQLVIQRIMDTLQPIEKQVTREWRYKMFLEALHKEEDSRAASEGPNYKQNVDDRTKDATDNEGAEMQQRVQDLVTKETIVSKEGNSKECVKGLFCLWDLLGELDDQ